MKLEDRRAERTMTEELKEPQEPEESFNPIEHEQAFGSAYRSYRIDGRSRMDVDTFFSHIRGELISLINQELTDLNSARVQMTAWIRFIQEFDDVVEIDRVELAFNSRMEEVRQGSDLSRIVDGMIAHMKTQIEIPALANSRFRFNVVLFLDINFHWLNLTRGSSYIPLPNWVMKNKAINKISVFEKKNDASVNVLALKGSGIYIARKSERKASKNVNLLLITNGKHRHYMAINSLSRLLGSRNSKHSHKQYFCLHCLQGFHSELSRDKHYEYCKDNEAVKIEMPKPGSFVEFHDGQNQFKVPFRMYTDFEAILRPVHGPSPSPNKPYTKKVNQHIPSGFCVYSKFTYGRLKTH